MVCPKCITQNSDLARYCNGCGSQLSEACSGCGVSLPPGARFCEGCGRPAGMAAATPVPSVAAVDKRSDPVTVPLAEKDLQTPAPASGFPPSRPRSLLSSLPTEPQEFDGGAFRN